MQIKKKSDIELILDSFPGIANWDEEREKHYLVFEDRKRGGQWTLMRYGDGQFSLHGRGEDYIDGDEMMFEDRDAVASFLWDNRSAYNAAVKQLVQV
ncbi:hypothetical protein BG53_11440 [Paenibacillus darwinianus]|uniref:Uncharacterized protein n=1 Tax=Paenibacillus darwinianus TaxID=1380763 RepID=A0A9W5S3W5_9BACL|nr:hypothetical protein [Paenibacillus darwinianus]EXX87750.1 hypothetical protein BG52_03475 [Paenibacillus darwinianus]EXX91435.1 hypothetical protein BG53_11440 [Paenibacillus darwinianus]EXX92239.1 hypothetical protein CH50_11715 [Paenibacillus darwinianus]